MTYLTFFLGLSCVFTFIHAGTNRHGLTREKRQYHHHRNPNNHRRHDVVDYDFQYGSSQPRFHLVHQTLRDYLDRGSGYGFSGSHSYAQGPPHGRPDGFGPPQYHEPPGHRPQHHGPPGRFPPGPPGYHHGPPGHPGHYRGPPGPPEHYRGPPGHSEHYRGPPGHSGHHHGPPGHHHGRPGHKRGHWWKNRRPSPSNIDFKFPEKSEQYKESVHDDKPQIVAYIDDNFPVILLSDDEIRRK